MEKTNKYKRSLLSLTLLSVFLFAISIASATVTLNNPANGAYLNSNNLTFNATNSSNFIEMENCSLWGIGATYNTSIINYGDVVNASSSANWTIDVDLVNTTQLPDQTFTFWASCWNSTTQENSTNNTVTIDNTLPTTPSSLGVSDGSTDTDGDVNFTATVNSIQSESCTLFFQNGPSSGDTSQSMSYSGTTCYLSLTGVPEQTYNYVISTTDGYNQTNTSETTFRVSTAGGTKTTPEIQKESVKTLAAAQGDGEPLSGKTIAIVLVVVLVLGLMFFKNKK